MSILDAIKKQYESNKSSGERDMSVYFAPIVPEGKSSATFNIRILPTQDGTSPFEEVYFNEMKVGKYNMKLYCPFMNDKEESPIYQVWKMLSSSNDKDDREASKDYRTRKYYVVKVIDRDRPEDGVKFWRFKHNFKQDGPYDKIFPIIQSKGNIFDAEEGRDLTIFVELATIPNTSTTYSKITNIVPDDKSKLCNDEAMCKEWLEDDRKAKDIFKPKPIDYLRIVAQNLTPTWDKEAEKWVPLESASEVMGNFDKTEDEGDIVDSPPFAPDTPTESKAETTESKSETQYPWE